MQEFKVITYVAPSEKNTQEMTIQKTNESEQKSKNEGKKKRNLVIYKCC